jgi:hypothetical protein
MKKKNFLEIALPLIVSIVYGVFSILFKFNLFNFKSYIASAVMELVIIGIVLFFIIKYLIFRFFSPNLFRIKTENIPKANLSIYDDVKGKDSQLPIEDTESVTEEPKIELNNINTKEPIMEDIKTKLENKDITFNQEGPKIIVEKNYVLVVNKNLVKENKSLSLVESKDLILEKEKSPNFSESTFQTKINNNKENLVDKEKEIEKNKKIEKEREEKKKDSFVKLSKFEDVK